MGIIIAPALECYSVQAVNRVPNINIVNRFIVILFKKIYSLSIKITQKNEWKYLFTFYTLKGKYIYLHIHTYVQFLKWRYLCCYF